MNFRPASLVVSFCLVWLSPTVFAISEYTEILKQGDWPTYVNGPNVSALPQVSQTLKRFEEDDKISIEIRYPGGVQGREWAESLANWLVTFGVPLDYLELLKMQMTHLRN